MRFLSEQELNQEVSMPRGDKGAYTSKQKRKAEHIEEGYEKRGVSKKEAEKRAWATVNKSDKGGKKSGSGRGKKSSKASSRKGGKKGGKKSGGKKSGGKKKR
jgi:plasmid stabilization system protein ParE